MKLNKLSLALMTSLSILCTACNLNFENNNDVISKITTEQNTSIAQDVNNIITSLYGINDGILSFVNKDKNERSKQIMQISMRNLKMRGYAIREVLHEHEREESNANAIEVMEIEGTPISISYIKYPEDNLCAVELQIGDATYYRIYNQSEQSFNSISKWTCLTNI